MVKYAYGEFLDDISVQLIVGIVIAGIISYFVPPDFFAEHISNDFVGMLLMIVAGIPLYVCATASIPIAASLMMKGLSPGAALVFLMAGPATNTATMAVIGKAINRKTLVIYMATIIGSALLFGYLTNLLLPAEWFAHLPGMHGGHQHEILPLWLQAASAILLAALILYGYARKYLENKQNKQKTDMAPALNQIKVRVEGMTCNHCKMNVEKSILALKGVEGVEANPDTSEVTIQGSGIPLDDIRSAVEGIGYAFKGSAG